MEIEREEVLRGDERREKGPASCLRAGDGAIFLLPT